MFAGESEKNGSRGFWMDEDEIQLFAQVVESESDRCRLNWVPEDGCLQMCVLRVHSQYFVPACVCVFSRVCLNMCVLIPCRPADRKKARRRQCLLFPLVAIATVHSGAAIISLITCSV